MHPVRDAADIIVTVTVPVLLGGVVLPVGTLLLLGADGIASALMDVGNAADVRQGLRDGTLSVVTGAADPPAPMPRLSAPAGGARVLPMVRASAPTPPTAAEPSQ
jgi:hypothetical protein